MLFLCRFIKISIVCLFVVSNINLPHFHHEYQKLLWSAAHQNFLFPSIETNRIKPTSQDKIIWTQHLQYLCDWYEHTLISFCFGAWWFVCRRIQSFQAAVFWIYKNQFFFIKINVIFETRLWYHNYNIVKVNLTYLSLTVGEHNWKPL